MNGRRMIPILLAMLILAGLLPLAGSMNHATCPSCTLPLGLVICAALVLAFLVLSLATGLAVASIQQRVPLRVALPGLDRPPR